MTYQQRWQMLEHWLNEQEQVQPEDVLEEMKRLETVRQDEPTCSQCGQPILETPAVFEEGGRVSYYHVDCLPETLII